MRKSKPGVTKPRRKHSPEYKQEALALATRIGVPKAAEQLGLVESQLYQWRAKGRAQMSQSEREQQVLAENARLKRQLAEREEEVAILKKATAYFAKSHK